MASRTSTQSPRITLISPSKAHIYLKTSPPNSSKLSTNFTTNPSNTIPNVTNKHTPPTSSSTPTPTSTTAPLLTFITRPRSCYLCDEQNPGDFSPTTTFLTTCLLCNRDFCPIHNSVDHSSSAEVCNINHSRYYHVQLELAKQAVLRAKAESDAVQYPPQPRNHSHNHQHHQQTNLNHRRGSPTIELEAEDHLIRAGIYPSLGERSKMRWSTSPVSDARIKEIESFRSQDAERRGTKGRRRSLLIETKEVVGADIAV